MTWFGFTVDFKGFFDMLQVLAENYSFGSVCNCPNGRSRFHLKHAVLSKWPIFPRIVAIPQTASRLDALCPSIKKEKTSWPFLLNRHRASYPQTGAGLLQVLLLSVSSKLQGLRGMPWGSRTVGYSRNIPCGGETTET
jgi:hypothetical protein